MHPSNRSKPQFQSPTFNSNSVQFSQISIHSIKAIRKSKRKKDLFVDELSEEALGLDGGDVATIVAPDENAAFDV